MGIIIGVALILCVLGLRAGLIISSAMFAALYAWICWLSY